MDYEKNKTLAILKQMVADGKITQADAEKYCPEIVENEDEMMIKFIKEQLLNIKKTITENYELDAKLTKAIDWLEKQGEQKPAWSEEDETRLTNIIIMLKEGASLHFNKKDITKAVDFLKSLKERYTWKPSKEQIIALRWIMNNVPYGKHKEEISGLLDQIKEL